VPPIRIHAHGVPLASPGGLTLTEDFTSIETDELDEVTAAAIRNYHQRHLIAPHPSDVGAFTAWAAGPNMAAAPGPDMAAPPAATASVAVTTLDDTVTTKEERPSRKR
jgi:hypothetical protein